MAYYPPTNSQTRHINQELEGYLHIFTSQCKDNTDELISLGEVMINPGQHPHIGFEPQQAWSKLESVNEFIDIIVK
jgi:hypothetical protein